MYLDQQSRGKSQKVLGNNTYGQDKDTFMNSLSNQDVVAASLKTLSSLAQNVQSEALHASDNQTEQQTTKHTCTPRARNAKTPVSCHDSAYSTYVCVSGLHE